jgi:hypothetical protein
MRASAFPTSVVLAPLALAMATVGLLAAAPGALGVVGGGTLLCWATFTLWPWAVLPVGIIGGTVAAGTIAGGDVRTNVVIHALILAAGYLALLTRNALRLDQLTQPRTVVDLAMVALTVLTAVTAVYGLALGNLPTDVLVAAYQIAVIPGYFFIATRTLTDQRRRSAAAILYLVPAGALTAATLTVPGGHGGLIALLGMPPLVVLAGRATGWRRTGAALLAALFLADVVLSCFRALWLAGGIAIVLMLVRGGAVIRRGMVATATAAVVFVALLAITFGLRDRASVVALELKQSSGYRAPESAVGLGVFAGRPLGGGGLGQSTRDVYLSGFAVTDVGPVYHAFYVTILANVGLIGLAVVLWPVLRAIPRGFADRDGAAFAFSALTCGFLAGAVFAGPTDGHWELGLLPALTLLLSQSKATIPKTLVGVRV